MTPHESWIDRQIREAIERGITEAMSGMEGGLDPSNPESIQQLLGSGVLEPEETPEQQMALRRLETLLALVESEGYQSLDAVKLDVEGEEDLILEPFLRDAPETLWPGFIIIEDSRNRWQIDLIELLSQRGYALIAQTRLNLVFERKV